MATRFGHTCIVAQDPTALADFYIRILGCEQSGPLRDLSGPALEKGMGLAGAHVRGIHLRLPGHGDRGPVLEIFRLDEVGPGATGLDAQGLMHLAFEVDDIDATLGSILAAGGSACGQVATVTVTGVGAARFVYTRDPECNVVELQCWT